MEQYSVLMSLYWKENPIYLRAAVESILNQTVKPNEIVIVEDGPLTNELYGVVDSYKASNPTLFTIVKNEKNRGLGLALNDGLRICRNELVARMDTDDISKASRCEKQLKLFEEKPDLSIVGTWVDEFISTPDEVISIRAVPTSTDDIYHYAKKRSAFNHPTVMYRRKKVLESGGYSDLRRNQDVDLFGRMLYAGCKAENLAESLLYFRCNENLAKRRKSWENTRSYIDTIYKFWRIGYASLLDLVVVSIAQTGMFLMPIKLQRWVYKNLLRNR